MTVFATPPRLLWLSTDAEAITRQLAGQALDSDSAGTLRDDISTDEISPLPAMVHFGARLGRYPYTGLTTADGRRPIGVDAIRTAGVQVVVAGRRYGKGSSREHAVVAERSAGVRLVVAASFERIYRQNADNADSAGLLTSTDLRLADRLARGEPVELDELLADRDPLAAQIVRAGGLLKFGRRTFAALAPAPLPESPRPMTLFDKIVARQALASLTLPAPRVPGDGGFVAADLRFIHEYYTAMAAHLLDPEYGPALALKDKPGIVCVEDHLSYVHRSPVHVAQGLVADVLGLSRGHRAFVARHGLVDHGCLQAIEAGDPGNTGSPPGATSPPSRPSAPRSFNPPAAPAPTAAPAPRPIQPR